MLFPTAPELDPPAGLPKQSEPPRKSAPPDDSSVPSDAKRSTVPALPSRKRLWIEMGVVLALSYLAWIYGAAASLIWPSTEPVSPLDDAAYRILYSLQVCLPLLYILHLAGEPWSRFGLLRPRWVRDTLNGVVTFVAMTFLPLAVVVYFIPLVVPAWILERGADPSPLVESAPSGPVGVVVLLVAALAGSFTEELVFRGYFISRLRRLGFGVVPTLLVSSALFASIHFYQGFTGPIQHFLGGLILGTVFLATGRLWPVVVAHALRNLLPLLMGAAEVTEAAQGLL